MEWKYSHGCGRGAHSSPPPPPPAHTHTNYIRSLILFRSHFTACMRQALQLALSTKTTLYDGSGRCRSRISATFLLQGYGNPASRKFSIKITKLDMRSAAQHNVCNSCNQIIHGWFWFIWTRPRPKYNLLLISVLIYLLPIHNAKSRCHIPCLISTWLTDSSHRNHKMLAHNAC